MKLSNILFLHQTTTSILNFTTPPSCQISSFYIKPQPMELNCATCCVVKYLLSTSNHNLLRKTERKNLLSNIFFLHQTTTVLRSLPVCPSCQISSFYIKPQRSSRTAKLFKSCQISSFYIKPQPILRFPFQNASCQISSFYIKPQLERGSKEWQSSCQISSFYIKPQLFDMSHQNNLSCQISSFYIKPQLLNMIKIF